MPAEYQIPSNSKAKKEKKICKFNSNCQELFKIEARLLRGKR
jgi:hypothetical protein